MTGSNATVRRMLDTNIVVYAHDIDAGYFREHVEEPGGH
jgi:hypothetical protein